jgi:hypothetical protein
MATATLETLLEYAQSPSTSIDTEAGVIRGVKVLGLNSKNNRRYLPEAARRAIPLYEGAKVNIDHRSGGRSFNDRIGELRGVHYREGLGLFADLHYLKSHPQAGVLVEAAKRMPSSVGLSHNVAARTRQERGVTVIESIDRVHSVDLVADPATTSGLFESVGHTSQVTDSRTFIERLRDKPSADDVTECVYQLTGRRQRIEQSTQDVAESWRIGRAPSNIDTAALARRLRS